MATAIAPARASVTATREARRLPGRARRLRGFSRLVLLNSCSLRRDYSNAKMRFQSFFMLMTIQPRFWASAISESGKVPIFDFGP